MNTDAENCLKPSPSYYKRRSEIAQINCHNRRKLLVCRQKVLPILPKMTRCLPTTLVALCRNVRSYSWISELGFRKCKGFPKIRDHHIATQYCYRVSKVTAFLYLVGSLIYEIPRPMKIPHSRKELCHPIHTHYPQIHDP